MALKAKSLFRYGYTVTTGNRSIDFRSVSGGAIHYATLQLGSYSLTDLCKEVQRALNVADSLNTYTVLADRSINSGTEVRITLQTNGGYFELLFGTGPRVASSSRDLLGFNSSDYTGDVTYTGSQNSGFSVLTELPGYNYLSPEMIRNIFGAKTVSARGDKEVITFSIQKFFQVEFRYEPEAKVLTQWTDLMTWMIEQKALEFTPEITSPFNYFNCTLESTEVDSNGLGYKMTEMLPDFPFEYKTGLMKFRMKV